MAYFKAKLKVSPGNQVFSRKFPRAASKSLYELLTGKSPFEQHAQWRTVDRGRRCERHEPLFVDALTPPAGSPPHGKFKARAEALRRGESAGWRLAELVIDFGSEIAR